MAFEQICSVLAHRVRQHQPSDKRILRRITDLRGKNSPVGPRDLLILGGILSSLVEHQVIDQIFENSVHDGLEASMQFVADGTDTFQAVPGLSIDEQRGNVRWYDKNVPLSLRQVHIVATLVGSYGKYVPYDLLLPLLGPLPNGVPAAARRGRLRTQIMRIRAHFRTVDASFNAIRNCKRLGYIWEEQLPKKVR